MIDSHVIFFALLALLVRGGQLLSTAGAVRSKNAASMAINLTVDAARVAMAMTLVAAVCSITFQFYRPPLDAHEHDMAIGALAAEPLAFVRRLPLLLVVGGAVVGATAERVKAGAVSMASMLVALLLLSPLDAVTMIFKPAALRDSGVATAAVIAGVAALTSAWRAGPRKGKYHRDGSTSIVPAHNLPFVLIGQVVTIIGWLALTASRAPSAATPGVLMNGFVGAAAAVMVVAKSFRYQTGVSFREPHLILSAGLAGVIAASGATAFWQALIVGVVAGVIAPWVLIRIEVKIKVDDVTSSAAPHLVGGILGLLISALCAGGPWSARMTSLGLHALVFALAVAATAGVVLTTMADRRQRWRYSESEEYDGGDLVDLDANAYPDFQQTTIKSYHAREA